MNAPTITQMDVRSVLGSVQGSSLRSARACARPSGLDAACAQLVDEQLRDGRSSEAARINRLGIDLIFMPRYSRFGPSLNTACASLESRTRFLTSDTSDQSGSTRSRPTVTRVNRAVGRCTSQNWTVHHTAPIDRQHREFAAMGRSEEDSL
jgi:hypothetical protein